MTYQVIRNSNFGHLTGRDHVITLESNDKKLAELHAVALEKKGFEVQIVEA